MSQQNIDRFAQLRSADRPVLSPSPTRQYMVEYGPGANRVRRYFVTKRSTKICLANHRGAKCWRPIGSGWVLITSLD